MSLEKSNTSDLESLVSKIKEIVGTARSKVAHYVNTAILNTYWEIGHQIVDHSKQGFSCKI